jgi:AraC family transcriptional regulator
MRTTAVNQQVKESTRQDYLERINRVVDFMNINPLKKPALKDLAKIAGFSEFHFHRIFQAMVGESLFQYQNKIRLAHSAHNLLHRPELSITDIAFESGYSTVSDFERSFKKRYRTTPSRFRTRTSDMRAWSRMRVRFPSILLAGNVEEGIGQKNLSALNVAYISSVGLSKSFKSKGIAESHKRLFLWAKSRGFIGEATLILGMYPDNPEITPLSECRYYACISVPEGTKPDGEIGVVRLDSEGRYVTFTFRMNAFFARRFFRISTYLYGRWIPDNGYYPANKPFLEIYRTAGRKAVSMEFCIPVRTR